MQFLQIPQLTAFELVQYEHLVGGLSSVFTVLSELVECIDFEKEQMSRIFATVADRTIQRTGYILEEVLGERKQAAALHRAVKMYAPQLRWSLLSGASHLAPWDECKRWKIRINSKVEPDDL